MPQKFGETLKKRRKARGITIVELSKRTGLSQADLVRVELEQATFCDKQRKKIAMCMRRIIVPN